ncbi:MAG: phytoene/squalene synthase family protein [Lewinellaceae bacterium]|nr:phytoene/squalene synthase family protein [Saprospiraceae bacterium]MCB9307656.1 phytoene/squalene synthase family protein [Lewinellaceae bacterium]MCB9353922.1 phytoene/squalene synthase family protein [Lewinellaceae bacterium]
MNHFQLFRNTCFECSGLITRRYSTSFSMGIRLFHKRFRAPIYGIYGFVRFADEIVDTFHDYPKAALLARFREDTYRAIEEGISLNPVLQAFQEVVHQYHIEKELIDAFLKSMEMDLTNTTYDPEAYDEYIYGSAEVVGLMCLRVFCEGDDARYQRLKEPACRLGAAFQKINFLRDIKSDFDDRGRVYFPGVDFRMFSNEDKNRIESDIRSDFDAALEGIRQLPDGARFGVYLAYKYYTHLFAKIRNASAHRIAEERFRLSDKRKVYLLFSSAVRHQLNFL